ncbi:MAG: tyrosine-type recombinase/integrase [Thermodesulfobacteriota bacterium]
MQGVECYAGSFRFAGQYPHDENGAPVRYIQELLGHESLESTQIYTRVTINDLKAVLSKYHPGN